MSYNLSDCRKQIIYSFSAGIKRSASIKNYTVGNTQSARKCEKYKQLCRRKK
jgi:hypothetical protein